MATCIPQVDELSTDPRVWCVTIRKFLPNLQGLPLKTCDHCLFGKAHRVAFHTNPPSRRPNVIDLIHTDVCTMQTKIGCSALYFVIFIDDHFRKVWGFALKTKDHVLDAFIELHAKLEREVGRKLKAVRADNGGECRGLFESYCKLHGI